MRKDLQGLGAVALVIGLVGFVAPPFYLDILIWIALYALVTLGLNLFMGYAGQVSLGQAAFFGVGAYSAGVLAVHYGLSPWYGFPVGVFLAAALAFLVGIPTLRLREHYLALATLGLGVVVQVVFQEITVTGGASGLFGIPALVVGGHRLGDRGYAWLAWGLVLGGIFLARNLVHSRLGRALVAIGGSHIGSEALGIDAAGLKRLVFVLSAGYAALAGSVYATWVGYIDPSTFGFERSIDFVLMSVLGGARSIWGALLGAAALEFLDLGLKAGVPRLIPSASGDYNYLFYGLILVVLMIRWPQGLAGAWARWREKR